MASGQLSVASGQWSERGVNDRDFEGCFYRGAVSVRDRVLRVLCGVPVGDHDPHHPGVTA